MSADVALIGVYDADGSLTGELRYWVGARLGRAHCSLCEITHGLFREKSDWRDCRDSMTVDFQTFHRDDAPVDVLTVCGGDLPAVVLRQGSELSLLLRSSELNELDGNVERFRKALEASCDAYGIDLR